MRSATADYSKRRYSLSAILYGGLIIMKRINIFFGITVLAFILVSCAINGIDAVTTDDADVMIGINLDHKMASIPQGTKVKVIGGGKTVRWPRVRLSDGRIGNIANTNLEFADGQKWGILEKMWHGNGRELPMGNATIMLLGYFIGGGISTVVVGLIIGKLLGLIPIIGSFFKVLSIILILLIWVLIIYGWTSECGFKNIGYSIVGLLLFAAFCLPSTGWIIFVIF
jgi:hypothetical protein